jgi:endonuclease-3 related protein
MLIEMPLSKLEDAIRPSGYFRLKASRLRNATEWWLSNVRDDKLISEGRELFFWRESLLNVKGIGPETADSILLYCFNLPSFVVDTYTRRIMARHFGTPENIEYHALQKIFMDKLPREVQIYNEFHALFVRMGKYDCKKGACSGNCPLNQ